MRLTTGLTTLAVLLTPTIAAADVSGPEIVGFVNAQRAAHGIPAGIVEDPALSGGCAKHNAYGARNSTLTHEQDPGAPGYTPEGAEAARTSVLYQGGPWTATSNPFETAPIHLHQLLAPRIDRMGASENGGYGCATTLASRNRPAPARGVTYTYPGDGTRGWVAEQTALEGPYTPGEIVGIPQGTTTGPYLYAMFDGPGLSAFDTASGATGSLAGPAGAVDVAVIDNTTLPVNYLPLGAQLIPREPLAPATRYTATVSAQVKNRTFTHSWQFTTADGPAPYAATIKRKGRNAIAVTVAARRDLAVAVKVAGRRVTRAVAAGERFRQRFAAPAKKTAVKVVVTVAGGRFVVATKR